MRIKFCPYTIGLIIIFSFLFLHTIFILNEDHSLMVAYETGDSGNLAYAVMRLFDYPIYNHHNNYFLSGYGWVFGDISFLVVMLLKAIGQLFGIYNQPIFGVIDDQPIFNSAMIAINFVFALISILLFFKLSNLLFENKKVSFIASLFFMLLPWAAIYSYWLKPDATGMVFILIAMLYLVKFVKQEPKPIYFYIAFISLVLTTFSKMYHGFILFPIFLIFFLTYCDKQNRKYFKYLFSKDFFKLSISSLFIYITLILVIHPYAIFDYGGGVYFASWMFMPFDVFIGMFKSLTSGALNVLNPSVGESQSTGMSFTTSFYNWISMFKKESLIYLNILLLYLLIIPLLFPKRFKISLLFIISIIFCSLYLLIVIYGTKTGRHYHLRYIYPIAPLLILNIVAFTLYIWKQLGSFKQSYYLKIFFASLGGLFFLSIFAENIVVTTNSLLSRAAYKHSTIYKTREFMLNHPQIFSQRKILMGIAPASHPPKMPWVIPHASVTWVPSKVTNKERFKDYINPDAMITWLNYTNGRDSLKFTKNSNPQFLILSEQYRRIYRDYIRKNNFKPIKTFQASETELRMFSTWFPNVNRQFNTLQATKKLIEVHRNPDTVIGQTIVFYAKR
ncbi:MAG: hypothetical protein DRQ57_11790 [Gammaproteobacteria bacterium]|nr:MAG: hypothetical protein DRQ57_11790 [Gammaproteobacteria bacterium]